MFIFTSSHKIQVKHKTETQPVTLVLEAEGQIPIQPGHVECKVHSPAYRWENWYQLPIDTYLKPLGCSMYVDTGCLYTSLTEVEGKMTYSRQSILGKKKNIASLVCVHPTHLSSFSVQPRNVSHNHLLYSPPIALCISWEFLCLLLVCPHQLVSVLLTPILD